MGSVKPRSDLVTATAGAMVGAAAAYWIGLRIGGAVADASATPWDTNLVEGVFDFIGSLFVIVLVALIAAVLGTAAGVWSALRVGRHDGAGRTAATALVLGAFTLVGGIPLAIAVIEAVGFGDEFVVFVAPLVPAAVGFSSRWLVTRTA
jgi:hypothetical protein